MISEKHVRRQRGLKVLKRWGAEKEMAVMGYLPEEKKQDFTG